MVWEQFKSMSRTHKACVLWFFLFFLLFLANILLGHWMVAYLVDLPLMLFYLCLIWQGTHVTERLRILEAQQEARIALMCVLRDALGARPEFVPAPTKDRDSMPEFFRHGL